MPDRCNTRGHGRAALFLSLCLCAMQASAERWYQVELLIFSQRGGELAEQWPATPVLAYPTEGRFLAASSEIAGEAPLTLDDGITPDTQDDISEDIAGDPGGDTSEPRPLLPSFVKLPVQQMEFSDAANTMASSGRYKVLFHETWIQPVSSKREAESLILDRSGDTGEWPLLQGSIRLWLSRYLHLETNLWLNTPGSYLKGEWQMPPPPLGPLAALDSSGTGLITQAREPEPLPGQTPEAADTPADATANLYWLEQDDGAITERSYPFRHAVALQQKRRMRSGKIHYVDHPMLGLLIKFTPLEE